MKSGAERDRLEKQRLGQENWSLWGPYLAERAWGTVREDYSPHGDAWEAFSHDQARSRAYRWNEDGLGGICDSGQHLCFALALWNGRDPILKERAFGLTGNQGNHGEDVKEYYFYLDATPSHSYLRYLYKYPQAAYPYDRLVEENLRRGHHEPAFNLSDTNVFRDNRYFDVEVTYAKTQPTEIYILIQASNRGKDEAPLHLLPSLWFRNTWSWDEKTIKPELSKVAHPEGMAWAVKAVHPSLGSYYLYGRQAAEELYTENQSNSERLWSVPNNALYVKDAFHRRVIDDDREAVNPGRKGTKFAAWYSLMLPGGKSASIELILSNQPPTRPFDQNTLIFSRRLGEADDFYRELLEEADDEDRRILRQAFAGMIWTKQFYHYEVERWIKGDRIPPPDERQHGRNSGWRHFSASHVLSMPDTWEYPWFAAWDLAFQCAVLALIDVDFAKSQIELLLKEYYLHPNGQIPAYEWAFGDVNPPVHALGALKVFRAERVQRGTADLDFLRRVFNKLLLNYSWWLNRKDADGYNIFEGGFMGLDNISVYDRSKPLPAGFRLKQADSTGWMAMFSLNMTMMALELAIEDAAYEDIAIQTFEQFLAIANTLRGHSEHGISLWDSEAGFLKDLVLCPDGRYQRVNIYSFVGLIPLFATEIVDHRLLANVPRFVEVLRKHGGGLFRGNEICACPVHTNERGEHILSLVDEKMLVRILARVFSEQEFLSPYGVRSISRIHAELRDVGNLEGIGETTIDYVPGESTSGIFGNNSNWRGPIWLPTNYLLIQAIDKFYRFLGDAFRITVPCQVNCEMNLKEIAQLLTARLISIYRRDADGLIPAYPAESPFQSDPYWKDLILFHEYFHGDTGLGLGAAHQTGWTGLLANLVLRRYRRGIPGYWRRRTEDAVQGKESRVSGTSDWT
jgi:hypothetical protein